MDISSILNPSDISLHDLDLSTRQNLDTQVEADMTFALSMTTPTRILRPRSQVSSLSPTPYISKSKPKRARPTTSNNPNPNYNHKHKHLNRHRQPYIRSTLSQSTVVSSSSKHRSHHHPIRARARPLFSQARFLLSQARETLSISVSESKDWLVRGGPSIMDIILDPAYTTYVNTNANEHNSSNSSDDGSCYSDPILERSRFLCPIHRAYSFTVMDTDSLDMYWSQQELLYVGAPVLSGDQEARYPESMERSTSDISSRRRSK